MGILENSQKPPKNWLWIETKIYTVGTAIAINPIQETSSLSGLNNSQTRKCRFEKCNYTD